LTVLIPGSYDACVSLRVPRCSTILAALLLVVTVNGAMPRGPGIEAGVPSFTWPNEFDYASWLVDAALLKLGQATVGAERYLDEHAQSDVVRAYMDLVREVQAAEGQLNTLHADPAVTEAQIEEANTRLAELHDKRDQRAPLAESILQVQISAVFSEQGFTIGGQPLPPLLFHGTPLPWALIASPRDRIAQVANLSLRTDLTLEDHIAIEDKISSELDLSTLVVPVGGIGVYPTMVAQSSHLNWLVEVAAHEWTHNYLTLRPLGVLYFQNQELTTMNETTANIVGKEIGALVIERYYPELVPPPPAPVVEARESAESQAPPEFTAPVFDFRAEMHSTRVGVDALLAEGKIDEAEAYMEEQRLLFWDHGYVIRKLNQAYFAFYGSYADSPVGAAGTDPVGAGVRELRARSATLIEFVQRMAWLTSFADLQSVLNE
jgi:hypothetical protein